MGFKKYVVFSILFIGLVYGYLFSLELGYYRLTLLEISVNLPIAVWIIMPLAFLFLATIFHIMFYGLLNVFKQRAINKDHRNIIDLIKENLLEKPSKRKFKSKEFKQLASILKQFKLEIKDSTFTSNDEELNNIVANLQNINNGKYVTDKSLSLNKISQIANKNLLNKVNEQVDFAVDVVKKSENYPADIVRQAFIKVVNEKSMTTVKKLYKNLKLDKELAMMLFSKDSQNNEFGFSEDEIAKIAKDLEFKKEDYFILAKNYKTSLQPNEMISLFEKLSTQSEEAMTAYLDVLFEYEMIDKVREIVSSTPDGEFMPYKALLDLKDAGKQYTLEAISYK
ncbi:MAG: hypothetical protein KGV43_03515 [Arcobacter sp.]|nr:hypothetical protein [Arcobacter sp.]